jgi:HAD superfamily hydrolase (TIGR01450 family)
VQWQATKWRETREHTVEEQTKPRAGIQGVVLDVTGTLVKGITGWEPIEGAPETVRELRRRGLQIRFFSNNPWDAGAELAGYLTRAGIEAAADEVITTGELTARYAAEHLPPGSRALVLGRSARGDDGLRTALQRLGMDVVAELPAHAVIVAGWSELVPLACQAIWEDDAALLATTLARRLPRGSGRFTPAAGAVAKAIEWATGKPPIVLGKPSEAAARAGLRSLGLPGEAVVVVGDHLTEDVGLGKAMGAHTALILSGATPASEIVAAPAAAQPDTSLRDVTELPAWLDGAR